eukprot:TRINITY_DN18939_c0_g1_i1.p1 TRINITY_DN18939_c0_g1~~TRINITY_DN18939_c0_g1_i1.p1  ORF type:complete len:432 (+),score=103.11 TRINITY_DN18939_c0_g1_i1:146-1441(+)
MALSTASQLGSLVQNIGFASTSRTQDSVSTAIAQTLPPTLRQMHLAPSAALELHSCRNWGAHKAHNFLRGQSVGRSAAKYVPAAGVQMSGGDEKLPSLNELPLTSFIDQSGYINPPVEKNTEASVFAVLDEAKKVQYIGFSKDVRNSLRTLLGRRPDKCHYYKLHNLSVLDQQRMIEIRNSWSSELGLPPPGNADPYQKNMWEKPVDAGSISERGMAAAGASKAKALLGEMQARGLKEEMIYDPALLERGRCDILPSKQKSAEELQAAVDLEVERKSNERHVSAVAIDGEQIEFDITFTMKYKTNGGWMYDVSVSHQDRVTTHRVLLGQPMIDLTKLEPEVIIERTFAYLLSKKIARQTEGLLHSETFPINYFSVSEVEQWFDDFKIMFDNQELVGNYWRFNRLYDYGAGYSDSNPELGPQGDEKMKAFSW